MKRFLPALITLTIIAAFVLSNVRPAIAEERAASPAAPLYSAATSSAKFAPMADTYIANDVPTSNFGGATTLYVGEYNGGAQITRTLLKFDLAYLSALDATVTGATLTLTVSADYSDNARTIRAYQLRRAWGENTSTWNNYDTGSAWTTAGAGSTTDDRYSTELGSASVGASPSGDIVLTLSATQVQNWVDGITPNNGLIIQADTENNDEIGYYNNATTFPTLTVTYTTDAGQMTAIADTSIYSSTATTNYGSNTSLFIGEDNNSSSVRRGLLKFDVSWLEHVGGTVTDAALVLTINGDSSSNTRTFRAYQSRRAWVETTATWNDYDTGSAWSTAGAGSTTGDRYSTEMGSVSIAGDAAVDSTVVIPLTASMVQQWVDGDVANNGIVIQADTETDDMWSFVSSETGTSHWNTLPTLVVTYTANVSAFAEGSSISSGTITASSGSGSTISGLTIGDWYGVETSNGPWQSGSGSEYDIALSNDAGTTWVLSETGNWLSWVENNGAYERIFFKATTTSIKVRAQDYAFGDNTGTIDYTLYNATMAQNIPVWQIGNYLLDGSAESYPYLNIPPWFPWSVSSLFDVARKSSWPYGGDSAPMCNSNFAVLRTSLGSPSYIEQEFMFYGGDMFITFGLRTQGSAVVDVQLYDPFGSQHILASNITNGATNWKAFNYYLNDQWLGRYRLRIVAKSSGAQSFVAVDGLSVGEGWYQPCDYNGTVLTPPGAAPGTLVEKVLPAFVESNGNLIANSDLNVSGGQVTGWHMNVANAQYVPFLTSATGYIALFTGTEKAVTSTNWIEVMYNSPVMPKGFDIGKATATLSHALAISYIINDDQTRILSLENVETGQTIWAATANVGVEPIPGTPFYKVKHVFDVPDGRYRINLGYTTGSSQVVYIDKICVGAMGDFVVAPECDLSPEELTQYRLDANYRNEQIAQAEGTSIAAATGTPAAATALAIQTQVRGTLTAEAQATQTALVAGGNGTQIAQATLVEQQALTSTPRAALTGTAFVQQFRATLTQIAGATQTRAAQVVNNNATAAALSTQQAQLQQTAWANATQSGQLTAQANYQATLHAQSTAAAVFQPTVDVFVTQAAQTQAAAATAMATNSNATTQYEATQAVDYQATVNAIATAQVNAQSTTNALLTAAPNTNATLQAQATTIAQQYATLIATYQALATQQVLEIPVLQPMPENAEITADVDCTRPTNAINIPAWIDYEVCRILWFFTPNQYNMNQIRSAIDPLQNYEPFGSIAEINGMRQDLLTEWQKYDWYTTGLEGSQSSFPVIAESGYATPPPGDVITLMQRATEVPLLYGNIDFSDPALNYAFSTTCTLRIADLIGPYITPPICFLVDVFRTHGYLPIARLILDLGAILLFIGYVNNTIRELLGEAREVERVVTNQVRRSRG